MSWNIWNADMLVLARAARARTQADVARSLDVNPSLISKWEHGVTDPPPERVKQLAEYLGYPPSLFYQPDRVRGTDSICLHHRKRQSMPVRALEAAEAEMHFAQVHTTRLLQGLNIETDNQLVALDPDEIGGPRSVAQRLRTIWRIPTGPIPNMVRLVESAGAVVLLRDMQSRKLDGMSSWAKHGRPLFFLNSANPVDRARWTIAHELGHLVMHATPTSGDPETEADAFAQELLIPEREISRDLRRLSFATLPSLKTIWRVSMKALITSADKLNLLPANEVKTLFVKYNRAGYSRGEPYPLSPEYPTVVSDAIHVHLTEHAYSVTELAGVVQLLPAEFAEKWGSGTDEADPGTKRHLRAV